MYVYHARCPSLAVRPGSAFTISITARSEAHARLLSSLVFAHFATFDQWPPGEILIAPASAMDHVDFPLHEQDLSSIEGWMRALLNAAASDGS